MLRGPVSSGERAATRGVGVGQGGSGLFYLRHWHPMTREEIGCEVDSVADVVGTAEHAMEAYRRAGVGWLAGVSIWRGIDTPEDSLSICLALEGWALIHTNSELWQTITRSHGAPPGIRRKVRFDDFLEIPSACFIDKALAIEAVTTWMERGELLEAAGFSDDLFSC
jgi:hypothetical protein